MFDGGEGGGDTDSRRSLLRQAPPIRDIDQAIDAAGFGLYTVYITVCVLMAQLADASEVVLLSFLFSCLQKEWPEMGNSVGDTAVGSVFLGSLIGALVAGPAADYFGRRIVIVLGIAGVLGFGIASAFAPSPVIFILLRTCVGFGIGTFFVAFSFCSEIIPKSWRGVILTVTNLGWCFGSMWTNGAAMVTLDPNLIPTTWDRWRLLCIGCAIPTAVTLCGLLTFPESPRWLLSQGRVQEAEAVIHNIAKMNGVPRFGLKLAPPKSSSKDRDPQLSFYAYLRDPKRNWVFYTMLVQYVSYALAFYGTTLLITRVYSGEGDEQAQCSFDYGFLLLIYTSEFVAVVAVLPVVDRWGRTVTCTVCFVVAAISVVLLGIYRSNTTVLVVSGYVCLAASVAGNMTTWTATPERLETSIRATATSWLVAASRVGAFVSSYIVNSSISVLHVSIILGVVNVIAAAASFVLPESRDNDLG